MTGDYRPWIRLRSPTGQQLGSAFNVAGAYLDVNVTVTGIYTVLVASGDSGADEIGDYTLTLAKDGRPFTISPGDEGGAMTNGSNHTRPHPCRRRDMWTFKRRPATRVILHIGEVGTTGDYRPWIRLRSPTGPDLEFGHSTSPRPISKSMSPSPAPTPSLVASADAAVDEAGDYTLTLAKSGRRSRSLQRTKVVALVNGGNVTGAIHVGDLDMWSFPAIAGDSLTVRVSDRALLDANFVPWIRVKSPTGQDLGDAFSASVAELTGTASVTGTYIVVVASGDSGVDATGTYRLTIANVPRPFVVPGGDQGGAFADRSCTGHDCPGRPRHVVLHRARRRQPQHRDLRNRSDE